MPNTVELVHLVNMWRNQARDTRSDVEAAALEKCADQIMQLIRAGAVEIKTRPITLDKQAKVS